MPEKESERLAAESRGRLLACGKMAPGKMMQGKTMQGKTMQIEEIGNVRLWLKDNDNEKLRQTVSREASEQENAEKADLKKEDAQALSILQEIIQSYREADYHAQITEHKNYTVMYQLAESRANLVEWIRFPRQAKVLETGAGCGTVTSALLKKAAHVTCQDERIPYCRLNAKRHKQVTGQKLEIYAMPFAECEPQLPDDYDAAVAVGLPCVKEEALEFLEKLRRHLKPGGMLILAAENKFGLKYWAGNKETHTHRYFAGLENAGVQLYSRRSLQEMLTKAGFGWQDFYYPYPDHRFARDIYSDKYLPKKGELAYSITNYEDDRLILFDEQKVFDSVIEEGQFPFFSNSYLCIAGAADEHSGVKYTDGGAGMQSGQYAGNRQQAVYVRYAADRSREFAVRTDMTDGRVRKCPVYQEGNAHTEHIAKAYERLTEQYQETGLRFNSCRIQKDETGTAAELAFIHGEALQEMTEQAAAAGSMKKIFAVLNQLVQYIRNGKKNIPFQMTEDFKKVFGEISDVSVLEQSICSEVSDIDLILPNILVTDDGAWNVIDYEWTFFFPIPQNFIIYRTLFFLNHENPQTEELSMENLLKTAGISAQEAEVYRQMEAGFQRYVTGGLVPYREMVNVLGRRYFNTAQLEAEYDRVMAENELLKGRIFWKAARKIKKKLTGN